MSEEASVDEMMATFQKIKDGTIEQEETDTSSDPLTVAVNEVDRLYREVDDLSGILPRSKLHVGVVTSARNGVCKYKTALTKQRFNKKITQTESKDGHVSIVINRRIINQGNRDGFIDTVRHELAHAICWSQHDTYPSREKHDDHDPRFAPHGPVWKMAARQLGADPASSHSKRNTESEYKYYCGCPSCGTEWGRRKRCKIVKKPFTRRCGCGQHPLVSYDAGDPMPEEPGTVAVESIPWDNREEWVRAGRP